jgi:RNA polymerase sigma-70 factor (ECF subfamily)
MHGQALVRDSDTELVERLRNGDEATFAGLIDAYSASLLRLAATFVQSQAVAEEVVQETWMAVVTGIGRFEGRSSVKTWLFKILTNKAKTRALRERRTIPFSQFDSDNADEPAVDPDRFLPASHPQWPGHWATAPQPWSMGPEGTALDRETLAASGLTPSRAAHLHSWLVILEARVYVPGFRPRSIASRQASN